jgi:hypothetical protein
MIGFFAWLLLVCGVPFVFAMLELHFKESKRPEQVNRSNMVRKESVALPCDVGSVSLSVWAFTGRAGTLSTVANGESARWRSGFVFQGRVWTYCRQAIPAARPNGRSQGRAPLRQAGHSPKRVPFAGRVSQAADDPRAVRFEWAAKNPVVIRPDHDPDRFGSLRQNHTCGDHSWRNVPSCGKLTYCYC